MKPGEIIVKRTEIEVNRGHNATILDKNTGDRPIQVGSHYHFLKRIPPYNLNEKSLWETFGHPCWCCSAF